MLKKLVFFLFLSFLFPSAPVLAGSPGLNLINNSSSYSYVPNSGPVSSWMTYIPETPENLNTSLIPAPNVIVRLHTAWTDTGKAMLGNPGEQTDIATRWCSALNNLITHKSSVYAEPFNELSHPTERQSPTGTLTLNEAIIRANRFISILNSCLSNVTVTSPALDPHNADFPTTSQAFSYLPVIAYHSYSPDTTHSYNSGPLAGKQFIFSEVGTIVNGQVVYDDCALVRHFCGQNISQFLQDQSNILAYTLFTFSPGDYSGPFWTLTNPDVVRALANDCDNLTSIDPDTCRIGDVYSTPGQTTICAPIRPNDTLHEDPLGAPFCPEHPYVNNVKNYPPENQLCVFTIPVSQTHINPGAPQPTGPPDPNITPLPPAGDITVHNTQETKDYSSSLLPGIYSFIARLFREDEVTDIFQTRTVHQIGPDGRASNYKETQVKKDITLMQAVLSLGNSSNINAFDVQIGWACQVDGGNWCYKTPLADRLCRPIYISEIAAQGLNEGPQAIKVIDEHGEITQLYTNQIVGYQENLEEYYGPVTDGFCRGNPNCQYLQRISREPGINAGAIASTPSLLSKLDHYCYNNLWDKLPLLQKGGSQLNLQIINVQQDGEIIEEYPMNVPYSATLINSKKIEEHTQGTFYDKFSPKNPSSSSPPSSLTGNFCQKPEMPENTSQDTLYVASFLARVWNFIGHIIHPGETRTTTEAPVVQIEAEEELYQANFSAGQVGYRFTPKNTQTEEDNDSYYTPNPKDPDDRLRLPAPGNPGILQETRSTFLIPKSQQTN
jgi:hypothetical protein